MKDGFVRVAVATPSIQVADCRYNVEQVVDMVKSAPLDTALVAFPELCLTGYTCGDLFFQDTLLSEAEQALGTLLTATLDVESVVVVGLPVVKGAAVYNCAAVCQRGKLLGLVPKTHLPAYAEHGEGRYFTPAPAETMTVTYAGQDTLLGQQVFACRDLPHFVFGVELCEDLFVTDPPSRAAAEAGATVIVNLSAGDDSIGKQDYRRMLVQAQSARLHSAYLLANAGEGESSTDLVFAGGGFIAENGTVLQEAPRYTTGLTVTEIDLSHLAGDRRRLNTFENGATLSAVPFSFPPRDLVLTRAIDPAPFVPSEPKARQQRCEEVLSIQAAGLARRFRQTGGCAVLGLSGGLDSTLALMVAVRAFDRLGFERNRIHAVTMPCFGTTSRTLNNARTLAQQYGVTLHEVSIRAAVTQHLQDIGQPEGLQDVTYENAQARERTQVLMDMANRLGGLVIGTGDLSELALGWATYNGDHMSMYGVNGGVPKTLVRHLVAYEAERLGGLVGEALRDVVDTPVSPELLPPENGEIAQKTEDLVGPYCLHDFFLYHLLRHGSRPRKIYRLACVAFDGEFAEGEIRKWLKIFLRRFFTQQFKRSCLPDGPRVGCVGMSPRGDLRMPSDATATAWLAEADAL